MILQNFDVILVDAYEDKDYCKRDILMVFFMWVGRN